MSAQCEVTAKMAAKAPMSTFERYASADDVEARFAARRAQLLAKAGSAGV